MTRTEHMAWCKKRALALIDSGDTQEAWASMISDLQKHPETQDHSGIMLSMMLVVSGKLKSLAEMRRFIEDFN